MDAAHGEDRALELGQGGRLLRREAVLEHEAGGDVVVGRDGEELGRVGVDVGRVQAAGLEEDSRGGDTETGQDGEVGAVSQIDDAAVGDGCLGGRWVGGRVEVEFQREGAVFDLTGDFLEAGHTGVLGEEFADCAWHGRGVWCCFRVAEHEAGGVRRRGRAGLIARWRRGRRACAVGARGHRVAAGRAGWVCWAGRAASRTDGSCACGGGDESSDEKRSGMHSFFWIFGLAFGVLSELKDWLEG